MPLITFLVEDNKTIRDNLIPTLEDMVNTEVVGFAETEGDAVKWLSEHPDDWDLAVVDMFLKEGSGLGILARVRPTHSLQRMVVLTNYATDDMRERCLRMGAHAVFDKSNELEEFFEFCMRPGDLATGS